MTAGLLFAVSAANVLHIIFWVGIAFVFLWFLGSCVRDGMWNNAIRCFNAYVALLMSFPVAMLIGFLCGLIMGAASGAPNEGDAYTLAAIGIGSAWVAFLICLAILQTLTDKLSQVKVAFHPVVNMIGSFIFVCGITFVFFSLSAPVLGLVLALQ